MLYEDQDKRTRKSLGYARFVVAMMSLIALMVLLDGFVHWALTITLVAIVIGLRARAKRQELDREEDRRLVLEAANREADTRRARQLEVEAAHRTQLERLEVQIRELEPAHSTQIRELEAQISSIHAAHALTLEGRELLIKDKERLIEQLRTTLAEVGKDDATFAAWQQAMEDQAASFEAERAALKAGAESVAEVAAAESAGLLERIRRLEARPTNGQSIDHPAEMAQQQN